MASFDFVESTSRAYRFVWDRRVDVVRFSAMVLVLKILFFVGFVAFDIQKEALRQGLLLLPIFFMEGWVIATLVIMALHAYEAQSKVRRSILPPAEDTARNIKASMIVYVLIKLMLSFVVGSAYEGQQVIPDAPPPEPNLQTFVLAVVMIAFLIWAFRFLWIYIPVVMGQSVRTYLIRFRAYSDSFPLLGVWVLCFVPVILFMILISEFYGMIMGGLGVGDSSIVFETGMAVIQAFIDFVLSLVSSLAVAYGMYSVFNNENKKTDIW
ncbi:MAG: hypothetical protein H6860_02315 [Rhodospirillales bacterium]|nr:hypothetical protein [Rhodospirillales bacterium]